MVEWLRQAASDVFIIVLPVRVHPPPCPLPSPLSPFSYPGQLAERGTVEDCSYTEHDRRFENEQHHAVWEPSTWADLALPIARYVEAYGGRGCTVFGLKVFDRLSSSKKYDTYALKVCVFSSHQTVLSTPNSTSSAHPVSVLISSVLERDTDVCGHKTVKQEKTVTVAVHY